MQGGLNEEKASALRRWLENKAYSLSAKRLTQKPPFAENFSKSGGSFTLLFVSNKCNPYFIAK